jgi:hypothetical protein
MKCIKYKDWKPMSVEITARKQAIGESFNGILWQFHFTRKYFIVPDFKAENYLRQENAYTLLLHLNHCFSYSKGQIADS